MTIAPLLNKAFEALEVFPHGIPMTDRLSLMNVLIDTISGLSSDAEFRERLLAAKYQGGYGHTRDEVIATIGKGAEALAFQFGYMREGGYSHLTPDNRDWLSTAVTGKTAVNYVFGENWLVNVLGCSILAGNPFVLGVETRESGPVDRLLYGRFMDKAEGLIPSGMFIEQGALSHADLASFHQQLGACASTYFIGGRGTAEAIAGSMKPAWGNLQSGRCNWVIVCKGMEEKAGKQLGGSLAKRMATSCSAPTDIYLNTGVGEELFMSSLRSALQEACGKRDEEATKQFGKVLAPHDRFARGIAEVISAESELEEVKVHSGFESPAYGINPMLVRIDYKDSHFDNAEIFGRGLRIISGFDGSDVYSRMPIGKTGVFYAPVSRFEDLGSVFSNSRLLPMLLRRASRFTLNMGNSTPSGKTVHANPDGVLQTMHSFDPCALLRRVHLVSPASN